MGLVVWGEGKVAGCCEKDLVAHQLLGSQPLVSPALLFDFVLERCRLPGCTLLSFDSFVLRLHGTFPHPPPEMLRR